MKELRMCHRRAVCAGLTLSLLIVGLTGCNRRAPESRIKSVEARIDGITCPTCVPPLKASLRRQYDKSTIDVDDDKDTATIHFADNESFSAADFRAAVERVRMRVVTVRLQACGTVDASGGNRWFTAGKSKFLARSDRELPLNEPLCADGTLDTGSDPATFRISAFSVQAEPGS
jgi:hypothetical protein